MFYSIVSPEGREFHAENAEKRSRQITTKLVTTTTAPVRKDLLPPAVRAALRRHRDYLDSDDYRGSDIVKAWRRKDRDRQADEAYNTKRRGEYAAMILATEGRDVRTYATGLCATERTRRARERDAQRKRDRRDSMSEEQARQEREAHADRMFAARKRKAGWTEPQIEAGLQKRRTKRAKDQ